jgi:hypothetical protein
MEPADIGRRLRELNDDAVALVRGLSEEEWHRPTPTEGWPVGVTARHIALGHRAFVGWIRDMRADGPVDPGDIDEANAAAAAAGVVASPAEVASMLAEEGERAVDLLTAIPPEEAEGMVQFAGRQMPRARLLDASTRHVAGHLASIRAAVEGSGA